MWGHSGRKIMTPNRGRDGAAFFDYVVEHYDNSPLAFVYLHGHAAIGEHLTCNSMFTRTLRYYQSLQQNISFARMVTLTEHPYSNHSNPYLWSGGYKKSRKLAEDKPPLNKCTEKCVNVFKKHNITAYAAGTQPWQHPQYSSLVFRPDTNEGSLSDNYMRSCCGSFIMPGEKIKKYPLSFYYDMLRLFQENIPELDCLPFGAQQQMGWQCFEYSIWDLFADRYDRDTDKQSEQQWYEDAYSLRHAQQDQVGLKNCKELEHLIHKTKLGTNQN
jgi:hypothetical protein